MSIYKKIMVVVISCFLIGIANADSSTLYDINGNATDLQRLKGKWIVINYWAAWCSICVKEIPELNRFYERIKNKNVVFFSVDYDELPPNELKASAASLGIQYPVLTNDPGYIWNLDSINVIPKTFIISPDGRVVKEITGPTTANSLIDILGQ